VTGIGEQKASAAWYKVITEYLADLPTMTQLRNAVVSSCFSLYSGGDYQNCVAAIEAVGLWTGDATPSGGGINVDRVMSTAYFSAAGYTRWLFNKGTAARRSTPGGSSARPTLQLL